MNPSHLKNERIVMALTTVQRFAETLSGFGIERSSLLQGSRRGQSR